MTPNTADYNEDELVAPSWMNNEFFEGVLRHCEQVQAQDIELKSLKLTPGTAKGDHYASVMFRAKIDYCLKNEEKTKSVIIKTMPEYEGNKTDMLKESRIFETEIGMYTEVIPKFEAILKAAGDDTKLGATCLYHSISPKKLIIFEDIVPLGYEVMRDRGTTLTEAKAVYSKIAKWHAISYKLNLEDPQIFADYNNGLFMQKAFTEQASFRDGITNFIELLETYEDLRQYKIYFEPLVENIFDECVKTFKEARENPQSDGLYVLCHGDFHHKNLMFKHDLKSQELLDVMLLDFQMSYLGPIVNDILYSVYMLLDYDARVKHLDEILFFYFTTFQETLRKINFEGDIPTMIQFKQQLMRHKHFDLYLFVTFLPIWYAFSEAKIDLDEILMNPQTRKDTFHNPCYLKEVRELLPKFLYIGYLEN